MSEPKGDAGDGTKRIAVDLGAEELAEILNGFDQDLWEHGPYFTRVEKDFLKGLYNKLRYNYWLLTGLEWASQDTLEVDLYE